nr:MAG TPA: hypothetical protein [Caudoviricetes sp.]
MADNNLKLCYNQISKSLRNRSSRGLFTIICY